MTSEEYIKLYQKYIDGKCNTEEVKQLFDYEDSFQLIDAQETTEDFALKTRISNRIEKEIATKRSFKLWYRYAAAAVVIVSIGVFLTLKQSKEISIEEPKLANRVTKPVAKKIDTTVTVLTLADGTMVPLDEIKSGVLSEDDGLEIRKVKNGELSYHTSGQLIGNNKSLNRISIPKGATYKLTLADGTKVWLNAASSLSYPSHFSGDERLVELTGEAYFEVAKNERMPFKVKVRNTEVRVLGTHFNVSSYAEDGPVRTVLLEGSVQLAYLGNQKLLKPGYQAVTEGNSSNIILQKANTLQALSWKNGYFLFKENSIVEVMNQIARWYKVKVVYEDGVEGKLFGGIYDKSKNLEELLKGLELTGLVKFKIEEGVSSEERRVIVMD
ncbi:fec operon regulator FecR [compost metagenome]